MKSSSTVDEYIAATPPKMQSCLKELRQVINNVVPTAEERISYGMPYYAYKGRLLYFQLHTKHIGVYIPPPVIAEHKKELQDYTTSKGAIQFPLDKPLPFDLIKKLIIARMKINEATNRS